MKCQLFAFLTILGGSAVSAGPAQRRAPSGLGPWISVDGNGHGHTITPILSTVSGVATTLYAEPTPMTITTTNGGGTPGTSTYEGPVPTATNGAGGAFSPCFHPNGPGAPFCEPADGDTLYTGETSYVTWDSGALEGNTSVYVQANYVNASIGGAQAFQSIQIPNTQGFIAFTIDGAWLQSKTRNNLTLFITSQSGTSLSGPTIMIMDRPPAYYQKPPASVPTGQALYIAIPSVFGFIVLCVCGGCIWNRKARKIGLGNVMGRRKGYAVGKSRRQRMGLSKKKGAIRLREQELTADGQYRDAPVAREMRAPEHRRTDSEALGSLVGTPPEDKHPRTNYFQEEMKRQENARR